MCILLKYNRECRMLLKGLMCSEFWFTLSTKERRDILFRCLKYVIKNKFLD